MTQSSPSASHHESPVLTLSHGEEMSCGTALEEERNILARLKRRHKLREFIEYLLNRRHAIAAAVARHLALPVSHCTVEPWDNWRVGQFNCCVIVQVQENDTRRTRKVVRCPLPWKIGRPQVEDEKIRSEVANFAWLEQNCPDIPAAHLIGFGWAGYQFTHTKHLPWYRRMLAVGQQLLLRCLGRVRYPYARTRYATNFGSYLVMDFISEETGTLLATVWSSARDERRVLNLYRGLGRIMASLARTPHSEIGSLRFNDDRSIAMSHRPLLCSPLLLESEDNPRAFRGPYSHISPFVADFLTFRMNVFEHQPNAVNDTQDCYIQMAQWVTLRAIMPQAIDCAYKGPYILQNTDLHQGNLFVDTDWNITGLIDLEFVCSLPPDMPSVPYWLTEDTIDTVELPRYGQAIDRFTAILNEEEKTAGSCVSLSNSIRMAWRSDAFWCYYRLTAINAMSRIMDEYIHPMYNFSPTLDEETEFATWLFKFWGPNAGQIARSRLAEKEQ